MQCRRHRALALYPYGQKDKVMALTQQICDNNGIIASRGNFVNTGTGPTLQPIDIGHPEYISLIDPDTAFWLLVKRNRLAEALTDKGLMKAYRKKAKEFADEMDNLRFFRGRLLSTLIRLSAAT